MYDQPYLFGLLLNSYYKANNVLNNYALVLLWQPVLY